MKNIKAFTLRTKEEGTTTIEFAIIFPFLFFVIFYSILLIFWINDASISTYEAGRLSRLQSVGVSVEEGDEVYNALMSVPTTNRFQTSNVSTVSYSIDGVVSRVETTVDQQDSLLSPLLIRLTFLHDDEMDKTYYESQQARVIRWLEPYMGFLNE